MMQMHYGNICWQKMCVEDTLSSILIDVFLQANEVSVDFAHFTCHKKLPHDKQMTLHEMVSPNFILRSFL